MPVPAPPAGAPGMVPMLALIVLVGSVLLAVVAIPQVRHHLADRVLGRRHQPAAPPDKADPAPVAGRFGGLDFEIFGPSEDPR